MFKPATGRWKRCGRDSRAPPAHAASVPSLRIGKSPGGTSAKSRMSKTIFVAEPIFHWTFSAPSVNYVKPSEFQKCRRQLFMFIDEESIRESLLRMVRRITPNVTLRDDLLQEALIHLWLTEAR